MTWNLRLAAVALVSVSVAAGCGGGVDLESIPLGTEVAVTREDGGVVRGTLATRDPKTVTVDVGRTVRSVRRDEVADVQLVDGKAPVVLPPAARFREHTLPEGTRLAVRLETGVDSESSQVEDAVTATLIDALIVDGAAILPAGSTIEGEVTAVQAAGKVKGRGSVSLRFRTLTAVGHDGRYAIAAGATRVAAGTKREDAAKIGIPAAGGAVIGAIIGGKKGAAIGGAIGGGAGTAVVLSTTGDEAWLPAGTVLSLTLDQPVEIRVPINRG